MREKRKTTALGGEKVRIAYDWFVEFFLGRSRLRAFERQLCAPIRTFWQTSPSPKSRRSATADEVMARRPTFLIPAALFRPPVADIP